jgi:hypothetical protein
VTTLVDMLRPDFLLRDALVGSVLVGLVCPLVGTYFVLRRMIFLGVALPQLSAAGIAFAFLAYGMVVGAHEHGAIGERALAMIGSFDSRSADRCCWRRSSGAAERNRRCADRSHVCDGGVAHDPLPRQRSAR